MNIWDVVSIESILAVIAIIVSLYSLAASRNQQKRTTRVEVLQMLHSAWDLMGGQEGVDTIIEVAEDRKLTLAKRHIDKALALDPNSARAHYVKGVYFEIREQYPTAE